MKTLRKDEITDLAYGASFLGTGGGGDMSSGMNLIESDIDSGRHFRLASFDELDDDDLIVSPYYVGAVGHSSSKTHLTDTAYGATRVLKHYLKENLGGIIAAELGGFATLGALHVAGMEDVPLLDADAAGRATPDLQCSMFYVSGVKMAPFSVFTEQEDQIVVKSISSDSQAELIVRGIASAVGSSVGVCDHPGRSKEIRAASVVGTISRSISIGKKLRKGSINGLLKDRSVHKLFRGYLRITKSEIKEGFTYGNYLFEGTQEYKGKTMKIWFKNENLISWVDDKIYVTSPDLISVTTLDLIPISNPIKEVGEEYFVFGLPADAKWRTPRGLEVMAPRFFGYDVDYIPIERVIQA